MCCAISTNQCQTLGSVLTPVHVDVRVKITQFTILTPLVYGSNVWVDLQPNFQLTECQTCWLQICHTSGLLIQRLLTLVCPPPTHKHKHMQLPMQLLYTWDVTCTRAYNHGLLLWPCASCSIEIFYDAKCNNYMLLLLYSAYACTNFVLPCGSTTVLTLSSPPLAKDR